MRRHSRLVVEKEKERVNTRPRVKEQHQRSCADPASAGPDMLRDARLAHTANRPLQADLLQVGQQALGNQAVQRLLRMKASRDSPTAQAPAAALEAIPGPGRPLPEPLRSRFEPALGRDLGRVRIHTDGPAAAAARAMDARAYAVGEHIVFGAGEYRPETRDGTRMIAHELVHVAQNARTGQATLQRWDEGEVDTAAIEEAISAVSHITTASVREMAREELERLRDTVNCTLETAFIASGSFNYRYLVEQRNLIEGELERRDVEQVHQDIIDQVQMLSTTWRTVLRQELASMGVSDVEDWALEAIGSFVGLPYMSAHELYGGPDAWRAAYQHSGVYPPAVVCDQLGELTQRLARGVSAYGPPGLCGHYAYYLERDASFPAIPGSTSDPRCSPGATLFKLGAMTWNFREQATSLDAELYNSGVPKRGNRAPVNDVRQRASDLNGILRGRWTGPRGKANLLAALDRLSGRSRWATFAADLSSLRAEVERASAEDVAGLLRAFAGRVYEAGGRTLAEHFEPDKKVTHEYTLAARVDSGPAGRLLFLDTWGPQGSGTMQIRPSTLGAEGGSHWGYVPVARPRRIPIYTPYSGVVLRIRGAVQEHTFDDIWLSSPIPPPVVFRQALESVPLPGLSAYLDFFMEGRRCESLLVGTLAVERGVTRFRRPQWMTERMEARRRGRR